MKETKKKILAITCEMGNPAQGTAIWDGQRLFIMDIAKASGDRFAWLEKALEDIEKKTAKGWVVMVGDRTRSFPPPATTWDMNATNPEGHTKLHAALEMYFALQSRRALVFEPNLKKFQIHLGGDNGMAFIENDDRGRSVYRVNWDKFESVHLVVMMLVAGAVMEEPLSDRWMNIFAGTYKKAAPPLVWPVFRVMRELEEKRMREIERRIEELEKRKHV